MDDFIYDLALELNDKPLNKLDEFKNRINIVNEERKWVETPIETNAWKEIEHRIKTYAEGNLENEINLSSERVASYLSCTEEKDKIFSIEQEVYLKDLIAKEIKGQLLDEVVAIFSRNIAKYTLNVSTATKRELDNSICLAISDDKLTNNDQSGTFQLLSGILSEEISRVHQTSSLKVKKYPTLTIAHCFDPKPAPNTDTKIIGGNKLSILDSVVNKSDSSNINSIQELEKSHWGEMKLAPMSYSPINPILNHKTVVYFLFSPKPLKNLSNLVIGHSSGRFSITMVPWSGQHVTHIAVSPQLPHGERAPIVSISEGAGGLYCSLDDKGVMRLWNMHAQEAGKSKFFPQNPTAFHPIIPECFAIIKPSSMLYPSPKFPTESSSTWSLDSRFELIKKLQKEIYNEKSILENSAITNQCFAPSITYSGKQISIMAGAKNGDIVKFNLDFEVEALRAPILSNYAEIEYEYLNPYGAPTSYILAAGDQSTPGNKVFRELFHFHRVEIILLEVWKKFSDTIISVDISGLICIWKYATSEFSGKYWFNPLKTYKIDLNWAVYNPAKENNTIDEPPPDIISKLIRSNFVISPSGITLEIFEPIKYNDKIITFKRIEIPKNLVNIFNEKSLDATGLFTDLPDAGENFYNLHRGESFFSDGKQLNEFSDMSFSFSNSSSSFGDSTQNLKNNKNLKDDGNEESEDGSDERFETQDLSNRIIWQYQDMIVEPKDTSIFDLKISHDGLDLVFLVLFGRKVKFTEKKEDADSGAFIRVGIENLELKPPFPMFELKMNEKIIDFSIGPIAKETLSRSVFLMLSISGIRCFSLDTAVEISQENLFPVKLPSDKFQPTLFSMCPSQRFFVFKGQANDKNIHIYGLQPKSNRKRKVSKKFFKSVLEKCRDAVLTENFSVNTINTGVNASKKVSDVGISQELLDVFEEEADEDTSFANELIEEIFNYIYHVIDIREELIGNHRLKRNLLSQIYGQDTFGVIPPINWPPDDDIKNFFEEN